MFLRERLRAFETVAADERWRTEHERAMACREFEDFLGDAVRLLESVQAKEQRLLERLRARQIPFRREEFEDVYRLYESWYNTANEVLKGLEAFEAQGYEVANADAFRAACRTSYGPAPDPEELRRADEQFAAGKGIPLAEVMDAIRRRTLRQRG